MKRLGLHSTKKAVTCLLTVCAMTVFAALPQGWKQSAPARRALGNYQVQMKPGGPVELMVQERKTGRTVQLTIDATSVKGFELVNNAKVPLKTRVSYPGKAPANGILDILLKIRNHEWTVYVGGQFHTALASPFVLPGTIAMPEAQMARQVVKGRYLPVPNANFITNFMIEEGAPNELYPWNIQTGGWHLHTAHQQAIARPETSQADAKRAPLTADKSPNFYSLKGGGKNVDNIITAGFEVYDDYIMTGSIQLDNGEAGLIFYHRDETVPEGQKPNPAKAVFYAFTLRRNVPTQGTNEVRLWKQENGAKRLLARAEVPLFDNQWYLPGVAVHGDEIICYLDHSELFRIREPWAPNGKFGLFANTPQEIRMDDITVKPFADIRLKTAADLQFHNLLAEGTATVAGKPFAQADANEKAIVALGAADLPARLVLGKKHAENMVFATKAKPEAKTWKVGMAAGWLGNDKPSLVFNVERLANGGETYTLNEIVPGAPQKTISSFSLPKPLDTAAEFELMADATEPGFIRFLKGGRVMFVHQVAKEYPGAFAVMTDKGTKATFQDFSLELERKLFKELPQKNPIFQKDSFMRHWASPEGQWIAGPGSMMWHKGDFFNDFLIRMPCIPNSVLHIAVADGKLEGPVTVSIVGNKLVLKLSEPYRKAPFIREVTLTPPKGKGVDVLDYTVHYEGLCLWVEVDGKIIAYEHLQDDLRKFGTRCASKGFALPHLARSKITRNNVIDEFFNESPFMWLANGGDWQIINRFQCTPSWSHMIGEAYDSLGAFWRKQIFNGDMTLEFYAGSRQGAYDTMGNMNCTIMAKDATAGSGYTVACTEWDQNLSQNWTSFYKDGKTLAKSDAYLVPRSRKGMYRRIHNPLIARGRPYHGAWFYIKLRKIGSKLEYYFDDELIFTQTDKDVLNEGLVGIWTFIHSMTLAQIKITYDGVCPRPVPVKMLPVEEPKTAAPTPEPVFAAKVNGWPVNPLASSAWSMNDKVGQSTLTHFTADGAPAQLFHNRLGAGDMLMSAKLPPLPINEVAGWTFKMKRTDKALLNAFFEVGVLDEKGNFKLQRNIFHQISGEDFNQGAWRLAGRSNVKGSATVTPTDSDWTQVTVWIPTRIRRHNDAKQKRMVRFGGFGLPQRDAIQNGIWGNPPNSAYAVANLVPIRFDNPVVELAKDETFAAFSDAACKTPIPAKTVPELIDNLNKSAKPGMNVAWLKVTRGNTTVKQEIRWVKDTPKVQMDITWDNQVKDAVRLTMKSDVPDRRLIYPVVTANGIRILSRSYTDYAEVFVIPLPRTPEVQKTLAASTKVNVVFNPRGDGENVTAVLDLADAKRVNNPPVLLGLNGFTPFYCGFEDGFKAPFKDLKQYRRMRLEHDTKTGQGDYLTISNRSIGQRLTAYFTTGFSIANYPVAQMRYKASDMAHVSLYFAYGEPARVQLSNNDCSTSIASRHAKPFVFDEQWRTWTGIVSDGFRAAEYNVSKFQGSTLQIRSIAPHDQTGRYSWLAVDDFVFGPSVKAKEQLTFTPQFFDLDGVASVHYAEIAGPTPYYDLTEAQQKAVKWVSCKPGTPITPTLNGMGDGVHHIAVKAVDAKGRESAPVDLPFMLDRKPMTFSHAFETSANPNHNGTLLTIKANNHGLAPWNIAKATFHVGAGAKATALDGWQSGYTHLPALETMTLNYPFLFRDLLNASKNGDTLELTIDNIIDGAGNTVPKVTIPFKVDYAKDKRGPNWYVMAFGSSVNFYWNWDGSQSVTNKFEQGSHNGLAIVNLPNQSPYIQNGSYYSNGSLHTSLNWKLSRFPYIAFRLNRNVIRTQTLVDVVLTLADKKAYTISLVAPGKDATELNRKQTFTWKPNVWNNYIFDVPQMMREIGIPQATIDAMTVVNIAFRRRNCQHNELMRLDDFMIFGAPDKLDAPDLLQWSGYDASGVASLEMTCLDDAGKALFTHSFQDCHTADLNAVRAKFEGVRWFNVTAKDKAGNASIPFWLPIYSPAKPKPAPAPAAKPAPAPAAKPAPAPAAKPAPAK